MSDKQINKQELIDWIKDLEDQSTLLNIKMLKDSLEHSGDWWEELTQAEKESIQRGEQDREAGRVYTSKEFWDTLHKRSRQ